MFYAEQMVQYYNFIIGVGEKKTFLVHWGIWLKYFSRQSLIVIL